MSKRVPALAGLLGGLLLVVRLVLDAAGTVAADAAAGVALLVAGLVLLGVAVLGAGLALVPRSPLWLRAVVGVGCVLLAGSLLLVVRGDGDGAVPDGVVGAGAALVALLSLVRGRGAPGTADPGSDGSAAAAAPVVEEPARPAPGRRRAR